MKKIPNATKQKLLSILFSLGEKKPLDAVSVRELCALAGISRTTFYNYYRNFQELLYDAENELIYPMTQTDLFDNGSPSFEAIKNILNYCRKNAQKIYCVRYATGNTLLQKLNQRLGRQIDAYAEQLGLSCRSMQRFFIVSTLLNVMIPSAICPDLSVDEVAEELCTFLSREFPVA